jgi:hypothetical protein
VPGEDLGFCSFRDQNESFMSLSHSGQSQTFPGRTNPCTKMRPLSRGRMEGKEQSLSLLCVLSSELGRPSFSLVPGGSWSQKREGKLSLFWQSICKVAATYTLSCCWGHCETHLLSPSSIQGASWQALTAIYLVPDTQHTVPIPDPATEQMWKLRH